MSELFDSAQAPVEDTLDTVNSESGSVENSEATEQHVDEQDTQQEQGERLYAGKYKSVEELEKAYQHMQKYGTKLSQQLVGMKKGQQPRQGTPAQPQYQPPMTDPNMLQQMAPVLAPFMAPMMQQLQQQQDHLMQLQLQSEVTRLKSEHDDFDDVAPVIPKLFESTPELFGLPNPVETAYLLAKSQVAQQNMKKVYDDAQKAAYDSKTSKQQAVTEGQQGKTHKKESPEEMIANEILNVANQGGSIF